MKTNFRKMFITAGVLLLMFVVVLSATLSVPAASVVTGTIGVMSAIYHVSPMFKNGYAFTAPVVPTFLEKEQKVIDDMDADTYSKYVLEKKAYEVAVRQKELWDMKEAIMKELKPDTEKADAIEKMMKTIADEHTAWGLRMKSFTDAARGANTNFATEEAKLHKFIYENADKIKEMKKAGHGFIEFKAVGPLELASASLPVAAPALVGVQQAPPTNVPLRGTIVDPLVTKISTTQAAFAYTESVPKDGNYAFVAEKGTKPQIDFKIETRYATPVKAAAYEVLTDEAVTDIPNLQAIATDFLKRKHDIKKENGILFGDGIAPNPKGATVYARLFSAGPLANLVVDPNIMDVINACITDIYTTHNFTDEIPYMANIAMLHPADFFLEFVAAKDLNGLPLFPTASLFNRVTLGGVTIIPFEDIVAGKVFVADLKKYNTTNYVGYSVQIGWINDQMITNQFTMVGESRFHAFVKKLDEQAFIYDTIATIKAALLKP